MECLFRRIKLFYINAKVTLALAILKHNPINHIFLFLRHSWVVFRHRALLKGGKFNWSLTRFFSFIGTRSALK